MSYCGLFDSITSFGIILLLSNDERDIHPNSSCLRPFHRPKLRPALFLNWQWRHSFAVFSITIFTSDVLVDSIQYLLHPSRLFSLFRSHPSHRRFFLSLPTLRSRLFFAGGWSYQHRSLAHHADQLHPYFFVFH